MLNHDGTLAHMKDMVPGTETIWQELRQEPLEQVVRRTFFPRLAEGDEKPMPKPQPPEDKTVQMNIRIREEDRETVRRFCEAGALNQREGFGLLVNRAENDETDIRSPWTLY